MIDFKARWRVATTRKPDGSVVVGVSEDEDNFRWVCSIKPQPNLPFAYEMERAELVAAAPELMDLLHEILTTGYGPAEVNKIKTVLNRLGVETNE